MTLEEWCAQIIFMGITNYDEPVMDGSDLDYAVWEDAQARAPRLAQRLRQDGYRVVKLEGDSVVIGGDDGPVQGYTITEELT